jgi:phosphoenolpyruvate carboxykinase (ATP)
VPVECPNVPRGLLNPRDVWENPADYDYKAVFLAKAFVNNFKKFEQEASEEILSAAPKILQTI